MDVLSHVQISHVTHLNELCHTYEWDVSQIWMSHVTCANESCHMCEWVMSCISREDTLKYAKTLPKMSMPYLTCEWVLAHIWMSHGTHMNESLHTYEWVMARTRMGHGNESCHILMRHANMNVSCLIWMTHVTYTCHVSYERLMSRINESCHVLMSHVNVDVSRVNESCQYEWVMSHMDDLCHVYMSCLIWMSHVTY